MANKKQVVDVEKERSEWVAEVNHLLNDIKDWAEKERWLVDRQDKELQEERLGAYRSSVLFIQSPQGRLVAEPVARSVVGADGRVDLYAWPSLHRVRLLRIGAQWKVRTDSGIDWPKPWNHQAFVELAKELTAES